MKSGGILGFSLLLLICVSVFSPLTNWESLSIAMFVYFFLEFLLNLGKKVVIFDITILLAIATCLVMPVIFYHVYTKQDRLAHMWVKYMLIPTDEYFAFALPAIAMMIIGFRAPLGSSHVDKNPVYYMQRMQEELVNKPRVGMILIITGIVSGLFTNFVPEEVKQFFYFLDHLIYVGVFYVLYSPIKNRKLVILVVAIMVGESIAIGMFGELIFMLALSLILMLLGKKISFGRKLAFALAGAYLILLLQSIKIDYRKQAWRGEGADPVYFAALIGDRVSDPSSMFDENASFLLAVRLNQGWLVATTMYNVPDKHPYAYGETIWQSVAASFVPRFIWPDKPEAGGKANLKRFWGFNLVGYSMNIGPIGEAYGNFGKWGGIIYMFFYGLMFNVLLSVLLRLANTRPTLILWVPFLFLYAVGIETDLLTTLNSLLKGVFFTWIIFEVFRIGFRIRL